MAEFRVGHGFDVHRLLAGRPLVIGGVTIPHETGLEGHSDADVLLHAIADALLGAAGLPDIGQQFPPSDEQYRDADSGLLLKQVGKKILAAGWGQVQNIDAVIMAERPQMAEHIESMRTNIARHLVIEKERVSIKATTCERLGLVGREEGIAVSAVCLLAWG